jgi:hypothetical protein
LRFVKDFFYALPEPSPCEDVLSKSAVATRGKKPFKTGPKNRSGAGAGCPNEKGRLKRRQKTGLTRIDGYDEGGNAGCLLLSYRYKWSKFKLI